MQTECKLLPSAAGGLSSLSLRAGFLHHSFPFHCADNLRANLSPETSTSWQGDVREQHRNVCGPNGEGRSYDLNSKGTGAKGH